MILILVQDDRFLHSQEKLAGSELSQVYAFKTIHAFSLGLIDVFILGERRGLTPETFVTGRKSRARPQISTYSRSDNYSLRGETYG